MNKININLINSEKSDIKYELFTFNDGEPHIKFIEEIPHKVDSYTVITRITNPTELFILLQVGDILERHGLEYDIFITYLMGMRMDRVMTFNESFSLNVVANMLNTLHPNHVYIFTPHSQRSLNLINNAEDFTYIDMPNNSDYIICYPDHGAYLRYNVYYLSESYITLNKTRDVNTGQITGMEITDEYIKNNVNDDVPILILDDLCDGGRTFIEAYKLLHEKYPNKKIDIYITHAVNPDGLKKLKETFNHVYITNTYADYESHDNVTVFSYENY